MTTFAAPIPTSGGTAVYTVAFDPNDTVASTNSLAYPANARAPFFWRPWFDIAPTLAHYNTANSSGNTQCASCSAGQHSVSYSAQGIQVCQQRCRTGPKARCGPGQGAQAGARTGAL